MTPCPPIADSDLDAVLRDTAGLWPEAAGGRIFITGGTGFFGCWLLETLLHANRSLGLGVKATVLTRDPARFLAKAPHLAGAAGVRLIGGHMGDMSGVEGPFDFAVHAASQNNFDRNLEGARQLIEVLRRTGVRKFLFTSSGTVYGPQPPEIDRIGEDSGLAPDPTHPDSMFGESKRVSELLFTMAGRGPGGFEAKMARCFAFVGPHLPLDINYAIGNFLRDALGGGPIRISGDGTPLRSYLYGTDLAVWLWTMLFRAPPFRALNVGSEEPFSILEVARTVRDRVAPGAEVLVAQAPAPGARPARYLPDTLRARTELGLRATVGLADAIERTARWHRARLKADPTKSAFPWQSPPWPSGQGSPEGALGPGRSRAGLSAGSPR